MGKFIDGFFYFINAFPSLNITGSTFFEKAESSQGEGNPYVCDRRALERDRRKIDQSMRSAIRKVVREL